MSDLIFDEDYTGQRWTYGMNYRPLSYASIPDGWIIFSNRKDTRYNFGTIDYPFELTPEQIERYNLTPVKETA